MLSAPARGYIHVEKHEKKVCIKSDFKDNVLKLVTNWQSDKGFLLTSTFVTKGLSACPGAIYMYKRIIYQDQVSGERLQDYWSSGCVMWLKC